MAARRVGGAESFPGASHILPLAREERGDGDPPSPAQNADTEHTWVGEVDLNLASVGWRCSIADPGQRESGALATGLDGLPSVAR